MCRLIGAIKYSPTQKYYKPKHVIREDKLHAVSLQNLKDVSESLSSSKFSSEMTNEHENVEDFNAEPIYGDRKNEKSSDTYVEDPISDDFDIEAINDNDNTSEDDSVDKDIEQMQEVISDGDTITMNFIMKSIGTQKNSEPNLVNNNDDKFQKENSSRLKQSFENIRQQYKKSPIVDELSGTWYFF